MDISLFSCNKSEIKPNKQPEEPSVRPKARRTARMGPAPRRMPKVSVVGAAATSEDDFQTPHRSIRRTPSTFRWRSSPEVVENSLKEMCFTITGTLNCLNTEDVTEMIEFCGGTVYKSLAKKSTHLIIGNKPSKAMIKNAVHLQKTVLNEKDFLDLVRNNGKIQKFWKYREQKDDKEDAESGSDILVISSDSEDG